MIILFIIGILLGAVAVIFALQNVAVITVAFFSWHLTGPLAYILLLAIASGILIAVLLLLPESVGNHLRYRSLRHENERLAEELRKQKELTVFAHKTPPTAEEIARIEDGASV